jgi:acyl-homoserine-lactone acylase
VNLLLAILALQGADSATAIASRVEIVRTEYGVPHIFAEDLKAMGFGLGYVQSEDYGSMVAVQLVKTRGTYARYVGIDSIDDDFRAREAHAVAVATFHRLDPRTQDVYEGFAEGVNHYVRLHPNDFPEWLDPDFTAVDAHARDVQTWSEGDAATFVRTYERAAERTSTGPTDDSRDPPDPDVRDGAIGSNAWALHGSRTASGRTILLRNPHLSWDAGYYEAHVRVPGVIDFYGDFRIGGAFGIIGGFNARLGWATTNNYARYSQVYALEAHPDLESYAVLDGEPLPLDRRTTTAEYRTNAGGVAAETRFTWWTPFGPVIHEADGWIFVLKDPRDGEFRRGEQFLKMMLAEDREQWLDAMRMRAHSSSNFTYADADGNVMLYYNARLPALPHQSTGDTAAVARSIGEMWSELTSWDDLPLYLNPPGGYVQQANDTPDFINLNVRLDRDTVVPNLPDPRLRLRSQLSLQLIHGDDVLSLEDVIERKHSPRMLLADRVLDDLLAAASAGGPDDGLADAVEVLGAWDRTAAVDSRGGVLFKYWARRFLELGDSAYREPWSVERPTETPRGIESPGDAVAALRAALEEMRSDGVSLDARWGDVHRVIRGDVDEPVAGCEGVFGCFRTLSFGVTEDGRFAARSGDGWVLAVEFGDVPRAYSVLAYGQSPLEDSPHHADQAAMFARGELKRVAWTDADIERTAIRRYRPGEEANR